MLGSKYFEALPTLLPALVAIRFHGMDYALLFEVVEIPETLRKAVDVEHDEVSQQRYYDDNVYKHTGREIVVDAPE